LARTAIRAALDRGVAERAEAVGWRMRAEDGTARAVELAERAHALWAQRLPPV
jgi:hypothetical protein